MLFSNTHFRSDRRVYVRINIFFVGWLAFSFLIRFFSSTRQKPYVVYLSNERYNVNIFSTNTRVAVCYVMSVVFETVWTLCVILSFSMRHSVYFGCDFYSYWIECAPLTLPTTKSVKLFLWINNVTFTLRLSLSLAKYLTFGIIINELNAIRS